MSDETGYSITPPSTQSTPASTPESASGGASALRSMSYGAGLTALSPGPMSSMYDSGQQLCRLPPDAGPAGGGARTPASAPAVVGQNQLRVTADSLLYRHEAVAGNPAGHFVPIGQFSVPNNEIVRESTHGTLGVSRHSAEVMQGGVSTGSAGMVYVRVIGNSFGWVEASHVLLVDTVAETPIQVTTTGGIDLAGGANYVTNSEAALLDVTPEGDHLTIRGASVPNGVRVIGASHPTLGETADLPLLINGQASSGQGPFRFIQAPGHDPGFVKGSRVGDAPAAATVTAASTWRNGYRCRNASVRIVSDGTAPPANTWLGAINGDVEVMWNGTEAASRTVGGTAYWMVRSVSSRNQCGYVPASAVTAQTDATQSNVTDDVRSTAQSLFPNGITVSFYAAYNTERSGDLREFHEEASLFARRYNSVGVAGGQLVIGFPIPITHFNDIPARLAEIQTALRGDETSTPTYARVATFALFSHGWYTGMGTGDTSAGNVRNNDVPALAANLSAFLTDDAEVALYACGTGAANRSQDTFGQPTATDQRGEGSFADRLRDGLVDSGVDNAQVMGHLTTGHTVENYALRVFGGVGTHGEGGDHGFNYVFPASYITAFVAELASNGITVSEAALRTEWWALYRGRFDQAETGRAGREMALDPEAVRTEMRLIARGRYGLFNNGDHLVATDSECYLRSFDGTTMTRTESFVTGGTRVVAEAVDGVVTRVSGGTRYTHVRAGELEGWLRSQDLAFAGRPIAVPGS